MYAGLIVQDDKNSHTVYNGEPLFTVCERGELGF
jgi:hypothetical protein